MKDVGKRGGDLLLSIVAHNRPIDFLMLLRICGKAEIVGKKIKFRTTMKALFQKKRLGLFRAIYVNIRTFNEMLFETNEHVPVSSHVVTNLHSFYGERLLFIRISNSICANRLAKIVEFKNNIGGEKHSLRTEISSEQQLIDIFQ